MSKYPQLTLRELMFGVLFVGWGCAGLVVGGVMASLFIWGALVVTIGVAIVAFVSRDELRATAIGFLVPVLGYAASIYALGSSELDPYDGKLPTTQLIQSAFELIVRGEWIDLTTGEPLPDDYDPTMSPGGQPAFGVGFKETPDRTTFMSVAHTFLAMVFGYVGMKFAAYVYRRQERLDKARDAV